MELSMYNSLKERRDSIEKGQLIIHKESMSGGCYVSIVNNDHKFTVIRYFFLGDKIHHSYDCQDVEERQAWISFSGSFN